MFISFEGIDGVGKSTQIDLLEMYLASKGLRVMKIREPGGTEFSEKIRKILLSSKNEINPISELMLFEAARADLVEKVIKPELNKGSYVICDRFFDSTTAYQGFGRGLDKESIDICNKLASNYIKPDITFYLDLQIEKANQRSSKRKSDRIEKSGDEFFNNVRNGFLEIASNDPDRVKVIDASNNIEQTHELVKQIINGYLEV